MMLFLLVLTSLFVGAFLFLTFESLKAHNEINTLLKRQEARNIELQNRFNNTRY